MIINQTLADSEVFEHFFKTFYIIGFYGPTILEHC